MTVAPLQAESFVPDAANQRRFRDALGCFGTGVTIVTTASADGPAAITANSFSSVSLSPPLVLWSIDRHSSRYDCFANTDAYAIHILSTGQESLCMELARNPSLLQELDPALQTNEHGVPVLDGCLVRFDCTREALYAGGDHVIILGRVQRTWQSADTDALAFYRGRTGTFAAGSVTG